MAEMTTATRPMRPTFFVPVDFLDGDVLGVPELVVATDVVGELSAGALWVAAVVVLAMRAS